MTLRLETVTRYENKKEEEKKYCTALHSTHTTIPPLISPTTTLQFQDLLFFLLKKIFFPLFFARWDVRGKKYVFQFAYQGHLYTLPPSVADGRRKRKKEKEKNFSFLCKKRRGKDKRSNFLIGGGWCFQWIFFERIKEETRQFVLGSSLLILRSFRENWLFWKTQKNGKDWEKKDANI